MQWRTGPQHISPKILNWASFHAKRPILGIFSKFALRAITYSTGRSRQEFVSEVVEILRGRLLVVEEDAGIAVDQEEFYYNNNMQ